MSLIEADIKTGDSSLWDTRIKNAAKNHTNLPSLTDISPFGKLFSKIVRFTGLDEDRLMVEIVAKRIDDEGRIISDEELILDDDYIISGPEINQAGIKVGQIKLIWIKTPEQFSKKVV